MKIRIKDNSIRFRLTKSEVEHLKGNGKVESKTQFLEGEFVYKIATSKEGEELSAKLSSNTISIFLSEKEALQWPDNDKVGYQSIMQLLDGNQLSILLEKDFVCLDDRGEDESDNYPNPKLESKS